MYSNFLYTSYSPKARNGVFGGAGEAGEAGASDVLQAQEDERRMKFSYAVAEMIAMPPHTKQLLLQVSGFVPGSPIVLAHCVRLLSRVGSASLHGCGVPSLHVT